MTEILTLSAASVFYGGSLRDPGDREALISLTRTCLDPKSMSWVQPHTPQYLLATLMPSPGKLQANIHPGVGNSALPCSLHRGANNICTNESMRGQCW